MMNRKRRRRSDEDQKYPFSMVEEARKMYDRDFTCDEIAEALNEHWHEQVSWRTVYDWVTYRYRILS